METTELFGTERIGKILLRLAPPVMLAQFIQALYNIIDSLFIGRYSETGLTALSIIRCTFVTPFGVKRNLNSDIVDDQIKLEDLFA